MKKLHYIQPKMEMMLMPKEALMDSIFLAGSPTGPGLQQAPKIVPHVNIHTADTVQVF